MSRLVNTGKLAGKTVFITGASRGIGLEIAKKFAKDSANIVICAKTTKPHPILPGTIFSAAKEIEALGGRALPLKVDIRNEPNIREAIKATIDTFGGIDILINNASAISLTGTMDTTMKSYDLMTAVNGRATFLISQLCMPYLLKSKENGGTPHILNNSPPFDMRPIRFSYGLAYTMSKHDMTMCALGMSEEFRDLIAVNSLWPIAPVWTAGAAIGAGADFRHLMRDAVIMADAAYGIVCEETSYTGNFLLDEDYLRDRHNVTDFQPYQLDTTISAADLQMKVDGLRAVQREQARYNK